MFASGTSTDCVLSIGFHRNPSMEALRPTLGKRFLCSACKHQLDQLNQYSTESFSVMCNIIM